MNESNNRGEAMTELQKFRKWADDIGHWQIVAGVDRYLAMLETEEYKEKNPPAPIDKKARLDQILKERDEFLAQDQKAKINQAKFETMCRDFDKEWQKICIPLTHRIL